DVLAARDGEQLGLGHIPAVDQAVDGVPPRLPGVHDGEDAGGDGEGGPAALGQLAGVGGEKGQVDEEEKTAGRPVPPDGPAPVAVGDDEIGDGGDGHGAGDGDAVGGGEAAG